MKTFWHYSGASILVLALIALVQPAAAQLAGGISRSGGLLDNAPTDGRSVVSVQAQFSMPNDKEPAYLFITAKIKPGWHIYSITQQSGGPTPSRIGITLPSGVSLAGDFKPSVAPERKTEPEAYGLLPIEIHHGTVFWYVPLKLASNVDPSNLRITGTFSFGACDIKSCLPPADVPFTATLTDTPPNIPKQASVVVAPPRKTVDSRMMWMQLAMAFLGGIILNFMPCVLPVISLKVLAFVHQAGESRARIFMLNVWYSLGLIAVFMVLAALAAGAGMKWGEQFTLTWFKVTLTALVFVMALSFLGVWEIPIPGFAGTGKANDLQGREGPSGAFFKGIFTTILATPCSGPFLGPVFGYVLSQPPYMAYCIFGAVGLGMASPYLLIGIFPVLIRFLPKPGAWMETFKQIMGFLLLATVVYLFNTLNSIYFIPTLTLLVGLWFACWWIGRTPLTAPGRRRVAWCGGTLLAAAIGYLAFTVLLWEHVLPWKPFSPAALAQARAEGKTVMVDFTANWCPNCKTNSRVAIETSAVLKLVQANKVETLLADWTDKSPTIGKALEDLGSGSIPLLAIWPAGEPDDKVIRLPDLIVEREVLDALKAAGPSKK